MSIHPHTGNKILGSISVIISHQNSIIDLGLWEVAEELVIDCIIGNRLSATDSGESGAVLLYQ